MSGKVERRMLLVAYHFPPVGGIGAAGSQRAIKFARHLPAAGWRPVVLTVKESSYESYLAMDESLLAQVPPDLAVIRTTVLRVLKPLLRAKAAICSLLGRGATEMQRAEYSGSVAAGARRDGGRFQKIKDVITDLFEIPDEVSGWLLVAALAGRRAIKHEQIDVIFATGRPWSTLVVGALLKKLTGKPLVVDFRDPWMTNSFRLPYSAPKNRAEEYLESWVVRSADLIVANTDNLRDEFVARFGSEVESKCVTILNGFDPTEYAAVCAEQRNEENAGRFLAVHPGFLYGNRDPYSLLEAIRLLRNRGVLDAENFRCDFIGAVELDYDLSEYLEKHQLASLVRLRGPASYAESISALAGSDLALLLQPGTTTQIPSKLFEFVGFGKRIVTIAPKNSAVAKLVLDNGLGDVAEPDDVEAIAYSLERAYQEWTQGKNDFTVPPEVQARFDVRKSVAKLAEAMARLTAH